MNQNFFIDFKPQTQEMAPQYTDLSVDVEGHTRNQKLPILMSWVWPDREILHWPSTQKVNAQLLCWEAQ